MTAATCTASALPLGDPCEMPAAAPTPAPDRPVPILQSLDPRARILLCLGLLLAIVTTPAHHLHAFFGEALLLTGLLVLAQAPPTRVLRRLAALTPLILLFALPILFAPAPQVTTAPPVQIAGMEIPAANLSLVINVALKASLGLCTVLLLQSLLTFEALLGGLNRLHCPRLITTLLHLTHRYGNVLSAEAERMNRARCARGGQARWLWQSIPAGHLIGCLFVRSIDQSERVHQAMLARGFDGLALTGRTPAADGPHPARWQARDTAVLLVVVALLVFLRISAGL